MITLEGKYGKAKILQNSEYVETKAIEQLKNILNSPVVENQNIAVMPDVHLGKGSVIGYTQTIKDRVSPFFVGVDISCGIYAYKLKYNLTKPELEKLDKVIRQTIPLGKKNRKEKHEFSERISLDTLIANVDKEKELYAIGSLGAGNHFIEIDEDENKEQWLLIHSGSRHLGLAIAEYWQKIANAKNPTKDKIVKRIEELKASGNTKIISSEIEKIKKENKDDTGIAFLDGQDTQNYLHDMFLAEKFAFLNREAMASEILKGMHNKETEIIRSLHNYIDIEYDVNILRKGATSLRKNELAVIPISMAYGTLIVSGLGNKECNYSGPHGAGRLMSRTKARETLNMNDYKESMRGIYSTSISSKTIDEAPMAYKPAEAILKNIKDLCIIKHILKPIYNLKASD